MTNKNAIKPDILARQLQDWAVNEMKFAPRGKYVNSSPPTLQDFKSLCRGPQMLNVWRFIIENVKSEQTIAKVEGNLKVTKTDEANDRVNVIKMKALKNEMTMKSRDLEEKKRKEEHLKMRLDGLKNDLIVADSTLEMKRDCERSLNHRIHLLESFNDQTHQKKLDIEQKSRMLKLRQTFDYRDCEVRYYNRKGSTDNDDVIENESTKQVRQCCEKISSFQGFALKGNFGVCIDKLPKTKEKVTELVKCVVEEFSTAQILDGVVSHCDDTRQLLLRHNTDSEETTKTIPIQKHIQDWQVTHVKSFIDAMKCKNKTAQIRHQLKSTRDQVYRRLVDELGMFEPVLKLARNVLDLEAEIVGWQAKFDSFRNFHKRFSIDCVKYESEGKLLAEKQLQISQFKEIRETNESHISSLVKEIKCGLMNLADQQSTIDRYVRSVLSDHHSEVFDNINQLQNHTELELQQFKSVTLSELLFNVINSTEKLHLNDMSITALRHKTDGSEILHQILSTLGFEITMAPEEILSQVIKLQQDLEEDSDYLAKLSKDSSSSQHHGSKLEELYKQAKNADRTLEEKNILLQNMLEQSKLSIEECDKVKVIIQDWWDQPGQFVTPWLVRHGQTFKQWKATWTVIVTKLRQLNNQ